MSTVENAGKSRGNDRYKTLFSDLVATAGVEVGGKQPWDIRVKNDDFYRRVLGMGSLGLGESYMDQWWECDRLDMFFNKILRARLDRAVKLPFRDRLRVIRAKLFNLQNRRKAYEVGKRHYDLDNALFEKMLDPYMQYSCGYWKDCDNLNDAQVAKLDLICRKLALRPGLRVLDIGCGWGGACRISGQASWCITGGCDHFKRAGKKSQATDSTSGCGYSPSGLS